MWRERGRGGEATHAEKPPYLHDGTVPAREVVQEAEAFGVEELEEVAWADAENKLAPE